MIYKMKLHSERNIDGEFNVLRVAGGWLYFSRDENGYVTTSCFVPFNNEFSEEVNIFDDKKEIDDNFIEVDEAAKILKIKKSTLYKLTSKRMIKFYNPGKILLFKKADLLEYLEKSCISIINKE